jgi:hypothetical protein
MDILARLFSWKSSLLGVFVLVSSLGTLLTAVAGSASALIDGNPGTVPDWATVTMAATACGVAFKLIWAKEADNAVDKGKK